MAGKICDGGANLNPNIRDGRCYADGVEARMASNAPGDYPLATQDPAGKAAWDQGVTDATAGIPATSCTAYAGLTGPV